MTLEELREELTKRGIAFAPNAGAANLQAKLDEAIAKEQEEANRKAAEEAQRKEHEAAAREATGQTTPVEVSPGNSSSGAVPDAAPAAVPSTVPAEPGVPTNLEAAADNRMDALYRAVAPAVSWWDKDDEYYERMVAAKVAAGLPLADAIEVTARQRAEDDAAEDDGDD